MTNAAEPLLHLFDSTGMTFSDVLWVCNAFFGGFMAVAPFVICCLPSVVNYRIRAIVEG